MVMFDEAAAEDVVNDAKAAVRARGRKPIARPKPVADTKWGGAVTGGDYGYQLVPDGLLRHQDALGLDPTDVVVLLNIAMHWWESEPDKMPHPRPVTIAQRMGASTRTVERHIARLCQRGLLEWLPPEARADAPSVRKFRLTGLVKALERYATEGDDGAVAEGFE